MGWIEVICPMKYPSTRSQHPPPLPNLRSVNTSQIDRSTLPFLFSFQYPLLQMRFISVFIQSLCAAALVSAAPASKSADSVKRPLGSTLWHPTMFNMPQSSSDDSSPAANNIAYKAGTQVLTGDTRVHILYYVRMLKQRGGGKRLIHSHHP